MIITINELYFDTIIGILEFERKSKQRVIVTCKIEYIYEKEFINYADVVTLIEQTTIEKEFELLEEALLHVSQLLKTTFEAINTLTLSYTKPDILPNCRVSLSETFHY